MILSGELKDFSLADVLQLLLQQRKSGVLNLSNGKEKAELFISQGNVNGVRVNGEMPEDKIREMLLASGKVDKNEMLQLEQLSKEMNRPILTTLSAKGHLDEEDKKEWLQIISEDMICELFGWLNGQYEFGTGVKAQSNMAIQLTISTEFACMEGMRRIDEWPRLKEALPHFKSVFHFTAKDFDGDKQSWDFLVLSLVDGRKSVAQIGQQVPFGAFRLSECIVNLHSGGFIAPVADSLDEVVQAAHVDPQSEKDRKTAMVLGVAVVLLVCATTIRLLTLWMHGAETSVAADYVTPPGFESNIANKMMKENVEVFLVDHADRTGNFPTSLNQLVKSGALVPREINLGDGEKLFYKKTHDKAYILK